MLAQADIGQKTLDFAAVAQDYLVLYGPRVAGALAVLIIGWIVARIIRGSLRKLLVRQDVDPTLSGFLCSIAYMLSIIIVVISALQVMGVQATSLVAIVGAAGLAIGLALKDSLGNFAAGVMLIFFRPFKAGDYVEVAGTSGSVQDVRVFATTLKSPDNKHIVVPNGAIISGNIINYSMHDTRRVDMVFGCGYGDDLKKAKTVLERVISEDQRILADPEPVIAVSELADSSVNFVVRPWVKTEDYWAVKFDVTEKVKLTFDSEGLNIPFPQHDVHVHNVA